MGRIKKQSKRGYYFSMDAFIALVIIMGVVIFIKPQIKQVTIEEHVHEDLMLVLSDLRVNEINNSNIQGIISSGIIKDINKSLLEQMGEFYANNDLANLQDFTDYIVNDLGLNKNIEFDFANDISIQYQYGNTSLAEAETVETTRQVISGIQKGNASKGFSARAFLISSNKVDYFYFGGYIGDGNITARVDDDIIGANIEGVFGGNFSLYINNQPSGNYSPTPNIPYSISLAPHLSKFNSSDNYVEFRAANYTYIAGGYLKTVHNSSNLSSSNPKTYLPGISGLINIYDSFYVPGNIDAMEACLHYNSSYNIFFTIGDKTVLEENSSGQEKTVCRNDKFLSELFSGNYAQLQNKTVPFRIGLSNASYFFNGSRYVDLISVTDISGSMFGQRLTNAKNANIALIDAILNYSGNKVGLAAYSTWAKKNDFYALSNDSNSLKNEVNSWNAQDYTCICCGILKAVSCFDKNIFLDNFNDQTSGSNPIGWTISEGNGAIDITSSSLEGNKAVNAARLFSQNPIMNRYFPPQQDKITTEFLVRHNSGTGRVRIEIEGANDGYSSFNDYIILKLYGGWIRNNDAQIVSYVLNTSYKIKIEAVPGTSTYDLYVNDTLVGNDLPVYSTRNNVARVSFTTESTNVDYTADDVKVFLTDEICESPNEDRNRVAIVMSDGQANRACGLNPVPDYDQDGDITFDPSDQAVEAACIAKQKSNITVHAVGFGNTADEKTLQDIANCGGGTYYFTDVGGLVDLYAKIANDVISAFYLEQTITGEGFFTKLYPDSYVHIQYTQTIPYGLIITAETPIFGNNISQGSFDIPQNTTPVGARVISYSGSKWTSKVELNNSITSGWTTIFNLSEYGLNFTNLGDPYFVNIQKEKIVYGNNTVRVQTGLTPNNFSGGSQYNKIIYTLAKEISSYSPILSNADGCAWNIEFEDSTTSIVSVPANYSGGNICSYNSTTGASYNQNDAINDAIAKLLADLDLNSNNKVDTKFSDNDLSISSIEIAGIPFPWETEVQIMIWR